MAFTLDKSQGTETATAGGTEDTIVTDTDPGIYVLVVDIQNLANGEAVEFRAYTKVLTGDVEEVVYEQSYQHSPGSGPEIVKSPPIESPFSLTFTVRQINGTGRDFKWRLDQLA
jgi:hypothetical protein